MVKVFMYTLSTCPWCKKTKQFFKENNVAFEFVDYDLADDLEKDRIADEVQATGNPLSFPFVRIGEEVVVGYQPLKFAELLGIKK